MTESTNRWLDEVSTTTQFSRAWLTELARRVPDLEALRSLVFMKATTPYLDMDLLIDVYLNPQDYARSPLSRSE